MFTIDYSVKYSDMDFNLALKPYSLLNYLQDIASENAQKLGFGYDFISNQNLAWFLIKYRMEFTDYPVNVKNLTVRTQPRGYNKLFAYREFDLISQNRMLGRVFSVWTLVDTNSRTPVLISNVIKNNEYMLQYQKKDNDLSFEKIRPIDCSDIHKDFEVRYNDLDVNGHANNGNYIVWAFEPLSFEFKSSHKLKTLDIMFKKEAKLGETISVDVAFKDDNISCHSIRNTQGEDLCLVQCSWV